MNLKVLFKFIDRKTGKTRTAGELESLKTPVDVIYLLSMSRQTQTRLVFKVTKNHVVFVFNFDGNIRSMN